MKGESMNIDEVTLYYLFSTFAQTYGAIIAVLTAFSAFRLQNLSNFRKVLRDRLVKPLSELNADSVSMSPADMVEYWEKDCPREEKKRLTESHHRRIEIEIQTLKESFTQRDRIEKWLLLIVPIHLFLIGVAVSLLFFTCWLKQYPFALASITIPIIFVSLFFISWFVKIHFPELKTLKQRSEDYAKKEGIHRQQNSL
jgi:hypothetical protein